METKFETYTALRTEEYPRIPLKFAWYIFLPIHCDLFWDD